MNVTETERGSGTKPRKGNQIETRKRNRRSSSSSLALLQQLCPASSTSENACFLCPGHPSCRSCSWRGGTGTPGLPPAPFSRGQQHVPLPVRHRCCWTRAGHRRGTGTCPLADVGGTERPFQVPDPAGCPRAGCWISRIYSPQRHHMPAMLHVPWLPRVQLGQEG